MKVSTSGLKLDSPARPLLLSQISYQGITSADGNALGTTLQDALCSTAGLQPSYAGLTIKLLGSDAAGQVRTINIHTLATGIIAVVDPFTDFNGVVYQIPAGTPFVILSSIGGGGGAPVVAPSIGLWMFGVCDPAMAASTTDVVCPNLAGFPDDIFSTEFWMQVIHNDDAPGTAPEREWRQITDYVGATGAFVVDAFSANVEADDLVAIVHESIMSIEIMGFGTLDTSSTTVPADSTRAAAYAWENDDYFKGCSLVPTSGNCRLQPLPIRSSAAATGVFTLDEPFSQLPGTVDYIIVGGTYPVQRLIDIFNLVNAMLTLSETGGTLTTDGTEQTVWTNAAPAGVFEPEALQIDCTDLVLGITIIVRTFAQINPAGALIPEDELVIVGPCPPAQRLKLITFPPNRFGVEVSLEQIVGAVGVDFDWSVTPKV